MFPFAKKNPGSFVIIFTLLTMKHIQTERVDASDLDNFRVALRKCLVIRYLRG